METYEATILKRIGYILFLVVIAVHLFNIGGDAETLETEEAPRTAVVCEYVPEDAGQNTP